MRPVFPYTQVKAGIWYYRITWSEGGRQRSRYVPLPGNPDTAEFAQAYWALRSGQVSAAPKPRQTWAELITAYRASRSWLKLSDGTRKSYTRVMERILEKNADKPVRDLTRQRLRELQAKQAATPRAADHTVQGIKLLVNWARKHLDWKIDNPAEGLDLFGAQREFQPWPDWAREAFEKAAESLGARRVLLAYHLGTATGQRPGDLVKMRWDHFQDGFVSVTQDKTNTRVDVFCPAGLQKFLAKVPREGAHLFPRNLNEPISYSMLEKEFRPIRDALGPKGADFTMHGWRYNAAVELAEAGCSDAEIQAVTGHKGLEMVLKYRRRASQRALSRQAQTRRDRAGTKKARIGNVGTAMGNSPAVAPDSDH